jgi:putative FmdB family regulatory protein
MPVYVYQCETCGITFERRQRMTEPALEDCPECDGHVHRVMQPVGIVFKGSGFYVTDNRSKSSTALPGKTEKDSHADSGGSESDGGSVESPKSETKTKTGATQSDGKAD